MTQRIFVSDGVKGSSTLDDGSALRRIRMREDRKNQVAAYMYSGWRFEAWGSAPPAFAARDFLGTGFYFVNDELASGDPAAPFGAQQQIDRLASGLHFGIVLEPEDRFMISVPITSVEETEEFLAEKYRDEGA